MRNIILIICCETNFEARCLNEVLFSNFNFGGHKMKKNDFSSNVKEYALGNRFHLVFIRLEYYI